MSKSGPVIVLQLPEQLNLEQADDFVREVQPLLECDRPRLVLDCSQVRGMESAGVEMLLLCMEEAMKRDGDLKLAAVTPEAAVMLELMRVDRLFEIFRTAEEAVQSFAMPVLEPAVAKGETAPWYPALGGLGTLKQAS